MTVEEDLASAFGIGDHRWLRNNELEKRLRDRSYSRNEARKIVHDVARGEFRPKFGRAMKGPAVLYGELDYASDERKLPRKFRESYAGESGPASHAINRGAEYFVAEIDRVVAGDDNGAAERLLSLILAREESGDLQLADILRFPDLWAQAVREQEGGERGPLPFDLEPDLVKFVAQHGKPGFVSFEASAYAADAVRSDPSGAELPADAHPDLRRELLREIAIYLRTGQARPWPGSKDERWPYDLIPRLAW